MKKLWTDEDQEKADYFLQNRSGWPPCFGCGAEGPYRMFFNHPYCARCVREGIPWADAANQTAQPSRD